jgi:hypothetical protein
VRVLAIGIELPTRPQKIIFAEMRAGGVRGLLIYCSDYHCSHWTAINGDRWPDGLRLPDIEHRFVCSSCAYPGLTTDCRRRPHRHHPRPLLRQRWTGRFRLGLARAS